jgi:hypothetical protein
MNIALLIVSVIVFGAGYCVGEMVQFKRTRKAWTEAGGIYQSALKLASEEMELRRARKRAIRNNAKLN